MSFSQLHLYALDGNVEQAKLLLEDSKEQVDVRDVITGMTALHKSSRQGHQHFVSLLVEKVSLSIPIFREAS